MKRLFPLALALLAVFAFTGCHTPASASFASVDIKGKTPAQIREATAMVLQKDDYRCAMMGESDMIFQKEGSRGQSLAYNGLVSTYYGGTTLTRFRLQMVDLGAGEYRLQGQAYIVRNAGDSFFEEEQRLANMRRGPYQRLLNDVENQLKKGK